MHDHDTIYVDGAWVPSAGAGRIEVVDPRTEEVVGHVPDGTAEDVDAAVRAARRAFEPWAATSPEERGKLLQRLKEALQSRAEEIAEVVSLEMGAPPKIASAIMVGNPVAVLDSMVTVLAEMRWEEEVGNSLVVREPVGVVGAITPWNYPLHQVVAKIAPALAAGCTVVLKPSEVAPLSAYLLTELVHDVGFPPGVLNLVCGTGPVVGEAIAAHPDVDMVSFTGSVRAGRRVAAVAAGTVKRVTLELGGKSANVVLDDVTGDALAKAVKINVSNAFLNSGQTCSAWTRLVVPRAVHDEVASMAGAAADAMAPKLGPMVSAAQYERVQDYIRKGVDEGASLVTGGEGRPDGVERGYFVRPTVFADVTPEMTIAQEEIFGPVLAILPYDDEADALAIANGTVYGLAGGVFSADTDRAKAFARRMRTGQVDVNGGRFNFLAPFGGYKQSGVGRELGRYGFEEFLEVKSIQL
ncbi:MAG: aldehyde dehydrogenase family protein [Frankiaceae bacterium]